MKISSFLSKTFLFRDVGKEELDRIISENPPIVQTYKRGETVYSSSNEGGGVGFILSGRCEVRLDRCGGRTVLNILSEYDSFGVMSVYSGEEFPTQIFATKNSEIVMFTDDQIKGFVNSNSQISSNLIDFLVNRISFLNKKVATFSANTVENRLAVFLLSERDKLGSLSFPFNCQKTAEEINAGRASVYRALSSLEGDGLISIADKKIYITDPEGLERIAK